MTSLDENDYWSSLRSISEPPSDNTVLDDHPWVCPSCKTWESVEEINEEIICTKCGTLMEILLSHAPEFRWFGSEDRNPDPSRCSCPINPLLPESSLGTTVLIRQHHSREMMRIKQYHLWNQTHHKERTLWGIFDSLQIRASNAGITPAVAEESKRLYSEVANAVVVRGAQREALLASCLYEALKTCHAPRRPRDIAKIFKIETSQITRGIKQFQHLFERAQRSEGTSSENIRNQLLKSSTFNDFIDPFLQNLRLVREKHILVLELTQLICERIEEWGLVPENTPPSLTATALTIATRHFKVSKTIKDIASACDISAVTIQKCLKRLQPWFDSLITGEIEQIESTNTEKAE